MKLLGSTENKISTDKNGENVQHLEITEVVLVHYDIVNNYYQQDSRVLYTFVSNKPFGSLLEISATYHIFLKTFTRNGLNGDLIANKIADKITTASEKSAKELANDETEVNAERATPKKRYIYPEERQQIIDELRLV